MRAMRQRDARLPRTGVKFGTREIATRIGPAIAEKLICY
jgi:hypothetical protein